MAQIIYIYININIKNELYEFYLAQNYFIDLIYNFGFVTLLPLIFSFYYTFLKIINSKLSDYKNETLYFILFTILLPFFSLSFNDIYIGSLSFFYWSVIINNDLIQNK